MATAYWNPTSGNDSSDGLSVANAKLTIAAAEAVAGLGGTVKIVSGTHSLSGLLTFAGGRTYESEKSTRTHLQWGNINGDRVSLSANSSYPTAIDNLKLTGLNRAGVESVITFSGSGDINFTRNVVDFFNSTTGNPAIGGNMGNSTSGQLNIIGNQITGTTERASSAGGLFTRGTNGRTVICNRNSAAVSGGASTSFFYYSEVFLEFSNNILTLLENIPIISTTGSATQTGNYFNGGDGSYVVGSGNFFGVPTFIDPTANNLELLPTSPAITGVTGGLTPDWYLDLSIGGTGGAGTSGSPWRSFTDVGTTNTPNVGDVIRVTAGGNVSGQTINNNVADLIYEATSPVEIDFGTSTIDTSNNSNSVSIKGSITCKTGNATNLFDGGNNFTGTVTFDGSKVISTAASQQANGVRAGVGGTFRFKGGQLCVPLGFSTAVINQGRLELDSSSLYVGGSCNAMVAGVSTYSITNYSLVYFEGGAGSTVAMTNSYYNSATTISGVGNVDYGTTPLFIDPTAGNLELLPTSPAITSVSDCFNPSDYAVVKYIQPGTGTGNGDKLTPYYLSQLTTAEAAVGSGGALVFVNGIYNISASITLQEDGCTYISENKYGAIFDGNVTVDGGTAAVVYFGTGSEVGMSFKGIKLKNSRFWARVGDSPVIQDVVVYTTRPVYSANNGAWHCTAGTPTFIGCVSYWAYWSTASEVLFRFNGSVKMIACSMYFDFTSRSSVVGIGALPDTFKLCNFESNDGSKISGNVPALSSDSFFADMSVTSGGTNNSFIDSLRFIDAPNGNFELLPTSPAIAAVS